VRGVQPAGGPGDHVERERGLDRVDGEQVGERRPVDELHDQVRRAAGALVTVVVDLGDARVAQRAGVLGLLAEAGQRGGVLGELRAQQLDRYRPLEQQVRRQPDLADAPRRYPLIQPVTFIDHLPR